MLSYTDLAVTVEEADEYATARAWSDWTGSDPAKAAALRRGQDAIAAKYNSRWTEEFDNDDAPDEVKYAIIEAARRELVAPGSMSPDLKRGGQIKRVKAGTAEVEYMDGAQAETTFTIIEGLLADLVIDATSAVTFLQRA